MKKSYLFSTFTLFLLLMTIGYLGAANGNADTGKSDKTWNSLEGSVLRRPQSSGSQFSRPDKKSETVAPNMKLRSGKLAYGFCIFDEAWTENHFGIYSFNTATPENKTKVWGAKKSIDAGAYFNGYYYAQSSSNNGAGYVTMEFGKYNAVTGEYTFIADWFDKSLLPRFVDFTIDYSTDPPSLLGIATLPAGTKKLVKIDMNTGEMIPIASGTSPVIFALACKYDGTLYAINNMGRLVIINKTTGAGINVTTNTVGFTPKFLQSATFDHSDGKLYWAAIDKDENGKFGTIDITTGIFTAIVPEHMPEFVALNIPIGVSGAPQGVSNVILTPGANGAKTASLTWINPSKDNMEVNISSSTIKIYRGSELITTLENQVAGAAGSFTDNVDESGIYYYKIITENNIGIGETMYASSFIGEDVPVSPTNVVLAKDGLKGIITWEAPTKGVQGGWFNAEAMSYKITRLPDNKVLAEGISNTTYTDHTVEQYGKYAYIIQAKTPKGNGEQATSNELVLGDCKKMPYEFKFDNTNEFSIWTIVDNNNDAKTWTLDTEYKAAKYWYNSKMKADDYLISPPLPLQKGKTYRISFKVRCNTVKNVESLKVFWGKGITAESQTNLIIDLPVIDYNQFQGHSATFTIPESEKDSEFYNIGFYACSEMNKHYIFVTDFVIEEVFENDLAASSIVGQTLPMVEKECSYTINVTNKGKNDQSNYTVQLLNGSKVINEVTVNETLKTNETNAVVLKWTPMETGVFELKGKVILASDQFKPNNETAPLAIEVLLPSDQQWAVIGDGTDLKKTMPIDFFYATSATQSIYLAKEIGFIGMVKRLVYNYHNASPAKMDLNDRPLKIYMASTKLDNLDNGWIPEDQMTLVYEGNVNIKHGDGELVINLTNPYIYAEGNLCIMVVRPMDTQSVYGISFVTTSTGNVQRTITYSNTKTEFNYTQEGTLEKNIPNLKILAITEDGGKISGTVKKDDSAVIADVKVTILSTGTTTTTDENGNFTFGFVPEGTYNMEAKKHGYEISTAEGIIVTANETTIKDFSITELATFTVTGTVKDKDGNGIEGAAITVKGYDNYETTTIANGTFSIQNVYKANDYSLNVTLNGFVGYNGAFDVANSNVVIPEIILPDVNSKPSDVVANVSESKVDLTWKDPSDVSKGNPDQVGEKAMKGYKVWRLAESDQNDETKWTLLTTNSIVSTSYTDNNWTSVSTGTYKYAVKALYSGNVFSEPSFSNQVAKDMLVNVTVNIKTNTNTDESTGATVTLTNKDNNQAHIYSGTVTAGKVVINNVWRGIYKVNVELKGFNPEEKLNVDLTGTNPSVEITMTEIIIKPYNAEIKPTGNDDERTFNWNVDLAIVDDFERHDDFTVNSAGPCAWSYIDGDGLQTQGITKVTFPNSGGKMAYIIFNPANTKPSMAQNEGMQQQNGSKYLAAFSVTPPTNKDYFISPLLNFPKDFTFSFWAKSCSDKYGLERMKVGYSTTGKTQADFTNWLTKGDYEEVPATEWTKYSYTVPAKAKYVTIECVSNDAFIFMVDDVFIGTEPSRAFTTYEVYLDGELVDETTAKTYKFSKLTEGEHIAGVKAKYTSGTSEMATVSFNIILTGINEMNDLQLNIYPNPFKNILNIEGEYTLIEIYNVGGKLVMTANGVDKIDVSNLENGIYMIKAFNNDKVGTYKIIK